MQIVEMAHFLNDMDAEVIYNLIELSLLERRITKTREMIAYYHEHRNSLDTFDKDISYYDEKIKLFESYLGQRTLKKGRKRVTKKNS
jgi:hypothetical protein